MFTQYGILWRKKKSNTTILDSLQTMDDLKEIILRQLSPRSGKVLFNVMQKFFRLSAFDCFEWCIFRKHNYINSRDWISRIIQLFFQNLYFKNSRSFIFQVVIRPPYVYLKFYLIFFFYKCSSKLKGYLFLKGRIIFKYK